MVRPKSLMTYYGTGILGYSSSNVSNSTEIEAEVSREEPKEVGVLISENGCNAVVAI